MTIQEADNLIVSPSLTWMGKPYDVLMARILLLAIGWQETQFRTRFQDGGGPARSFWQFEFGHSAKGDAAGYAFCKSKSAAPFRKMANNLHMVVTDPKVVKAQLGAGNDRLACIMARWLLYQDPHPLPSLVSKTQDKEGWDYYVRNWGPGKPRPKDWFGENGSFNLAIKQIMIK